MKNVKIPLSAKGFLLVLGLLITQFSWANQDFEVGLDNYQAFTEEVLCNYDVNITYETLSGFLAALLANPFSGCEDSEPYQMVSDAGSESFRWQAVPNAVGYTVASIGLTDGIRTVASISQTGYTFANLTNQEYIFAFLVDCEEGSSIASILIVDADIGEPPVLAAMPGSCDCSEEGQNIDPSEVCPNFVSYVFPWNNTICEAHKYYFSIGDADSYFADFTLVIEENYGQFGVTIADNCTNFLQIEGVMYAPYISDEDNFMALFTVEAAYIYLFNPALFDLPVSATNCGCYEYDNDEDPRLRNNAMVEMEEAQKITISPNPFLNQFSIQLKQSVEKIPTVKLYGMDGKLMVMPAIDLDNSNKELLINTDDLSPGVYNLAVEIENSIYNQRIVKL